MLLEGWNVRRDVILQFDKQFRSCWYCNFICLKHFESSAKRKNSTVDNCTGDVIHVYKK